MAPKETIDLADALQAQFPELGRDDAITKAALILHQFKAAGWKIVEVIG